MVANSDVMFPVSFACHQCVVCFYYEFVSPLQKIYFLNIFYSSRPLHLKQSHLIYIHLYIKITVRKMLNYVSDDIFMPKWFICFQTPKLALLSFLYGCHYASTHVIKKAVFCKHLQNKQKQKKVFCQWLKFAVYSKRKLVNMLRNFVNT